MKIIKSNTLHPTSSLKSALKEDVKEATYLFFRPITFVIQLIKKM